jgi:hypothetical protein
MFRFVLTSATLLLAYDHALYDGKYISTISKIARTIAVHFGI